MMNLSPIYSRHAFLNLVCCYHIARCSKEFEVPANVLGISNPFSLSGFQQTIEDLFFWDLGGSVCQKRVYKLIQSMVQMGRVWYIYAFASFCTYYWQPSISEPICFFKGMYHRPSNIGIAVTHYGHPYTQPVLYT